MTRTLPLIDPDKPFQYAYQPVVKELIHSLSGGFGPNLHSLYLYGSVARKTAIEGRSNVDIIVVTNGNLDDRTTTLVNTIKWRFKKAYPFITELSFQFVKAHEILQLESIFTWGFMLKHCSVCIYGDDLSSRYGEFEPSWEIAKYWNMDVDEWVKHYRRKIALAKSQSEQIRHQAVLAKKLLRASYSLIMHKDKHWFDDPIECGQHFLRYHPEKEQQIKRLEILLSGRYVPKRSVVGLIDDFGDWLVKAYKKTEFRIG
ncbi:nucleotidyltransferase [Vibrio sp. MACH09]|uniref:nucleotidyltransferase domain-containing protein n=1 Tax=Vibrio sp. MACH09 TaxID=3025122 RepID=UPI0027922C2A|nr:nucleotidyltransferase domain-containing protein [Vibrio sp. MACH09]GLO61152.1 nucleotidyltransferase [Vibrio sp. MACH09]